MLQRRQPGRRCFYKGSKPDVVQSGLALYLPAKKDARAHGAQATMGCEAEKLELKTGSFSPGWLIAPQTAAWLRGWEEGWPRATEEPVSLRSNHPLRCAEGLRASAAWLLTPPARRVQRASKPHRGLRAPDGTGQAQRREATTARGLGLHNSDACVLARNGSEQAARSGAAASRWCSARAWERNI